MKFNKKKLINEKGQSYNSSIWEIEVDYNNLEDLEKILNKIKSQINTLKSEKTGTKKEIQSQRFNSCINIYNTNINDLYSHIELDSTPIYYVYAHCYNNEIMVGIDGKTTWLATLGLKNIPFYIGKGTGNRAYEINRNETHRKIRQKLKLFDKDVTVQIIQDNLTELEALVLESKLIDILGIIGKGGKLSNLDEGVKSEQRQQRYSQELINLHRFYFDLEKYKKTLD